ncbi:hypothetical protein Ae201684_001101 [Aphanomyces euteiches]|uniref:Ras-GEF domain-containing protein n=1 Tax=Aphanomyces euteiches TaxID=100861 RepID=A0A6G0XVW8_9STRA|nr:hypothetical protein Ae201684_001101 [Aphanomyces euteiches]KAH9145540.1 hypothetical protein AeRB84_010530 [Aphanomyces euteiches]
MMVHERGHHDVGGGGMAGQASAHKIPSVLYERDATSDTRKITHATLGRLVAKLTDAHHYDTEFRDCFLLTYRSHSSVNDFIMKLTKRYNAASAMANPRFDECDPTNAEEERFSVAANVNAQAQANVSMMRAMNVLKYWIRDSGYIEADLKDDRRSTKKLMIFLAKVQDESPIVSITKHASAMLRVVGKILVRNTPERSMAPPSVMPSPLDLGSEPPEEFPRFRRMVPETIDENSSLPPALSRLQIVRSSSAEPRPQVIIRAHPSSDRPSREPSRDGKSDFSMPPPSFSRGQTMPPVSLHRPASHAPFQTTFQTPLTRSTSDNTRERAKCTTALPRSEPFGGMSAQEVADQLTLIEEHKYQKIIPRELTNKNWTGEHKHELAPNVMALIEHFDARADWVSSEILHPKLNTPQQRFKMVSFFIDVADACYRLRNFNSLFEIVTGLTAPCLKQLESTWKLVPTSQIEHLERLKRVCSADDNYRAYREEYAAAEGYPRLPTISIVVKDLFGFEESMPTKEKCLIHFRKCRKICQVIRDALSCHHIKYTIAPSSGRRHRVLHPEMSHQLVLNYRLETIRKSGTELFWLAKNANKQERDQFVNSLADAGFM